MSSSPEVSAPPPLDVAAEISLQLRGLAIGVMQTMSDFMLDLETELRSSIRAELHTEVTVLKHQFAVQQQELIKEFAEALQGERSERMHQISQFQTLVEAACDVVHSQGSGPAGEAPGASEQQRRTPSSVAEQAAGAMQAAMDQLMTDASSRLEVTTSKPRDLFASSHEGTLKQPSRAQPGLGSESCSQPCAVVARDSGQLCSRAAGGSGVQAQRPPRPHALDAESPPSASSGASPAPLADTSESLAAPASAGSSIQWHANGTSAPAPPAPGWSPCCAPGQTGSDGISRPPCCASRQVDEDEDSSASAEPSPERQQGLWLAAEVLSAGGKCASPKSPANIQACTLDADFFPILDSPP